VDNSALPNLVTAVDNLAQALINEINGGHWTQVQQARYAAEEIYYNYYIDLYHFAEMVDTHIPGATAQAQAVMYEVSKMYEAHGTSVPNDHGLSIYFPRVEGDYLLSYDNTAFASDTEWNEFLKKYYEGPGLVCEGTDTSCGIYPDCENCDEKDGCYAYGDGCEERDYYCVSNEVGCGYTYSNRHTDGWEDTGNTKWVHSVTSTQWVDTGNTRNKPDGTICGCTASNTLKRCYSGVCTDTGICDATTCGADAACDGKEPGDSCGGGTCDSTCKCRVPVEGEDIAVFRDGTWHVDTNRDQVADIIFGYGIPSDVPVVGDINQDGNDDTVIFRDGTWHVDTNRDQVADIIFGYGIPSDVPVVGDINQDGNDDTVIFRDGSWHVDITGDHISDIIFGYGIPGDLPVVGDINQDGNDDTAIFRDGSWHVDTTGDHISDIIFGYGIPGDLPVVGDINQDGNDDTVIFRDGSWHVDTNRDQVADIIFGYGIPSDVPVVGDIVVNLWQ
jgi:hypothetical protein